MLSKKPIKIALGLGAITLLAVGVHDKKNPTIKAAKNEYNPSELAVHNMHDTACHFAVHCGGINSVAALLSASNKDHYLRDIYSILDKSKLHEYVMQEDTWAFVMYRVGNKFYYTKHKILIKKGEKVLTDGVYAILERCGNLFMFSQIDAYPTSPIEPSLTDLGGSPSEGSSDIPAPVETLPPENLSPAPTEPVAPIGGVPCCLIGNAPSPQPVKVSEPSIFYMILIGLLFILSISRWKPRS